MPAAMVLSLTAGVGACSKSTPVPLSPEAERGLVILRSKACHICHSVDGTPRMGPTLKGLFGTPRNMADGTSVVADEQYIRRSITDPGSQTVIGATTAMPKVDLTDEQLADLVAYISSL